MKISKYFSYCLIIVLTCLCFSLSFTNVTIKAESEEVSLSIYKNNLSYSSEIYFLYSVQYENIDIETNKVELLFWDSEQEEYLKGTEKYSKTSVALEEIDGINCLVYYSKGIDAKNLIDDIYTRAYVKIDDVEYYSEVNITSVVEYIYRVKKAKELSNELDDLFDALLNYGAAAQIKFGYKTDKLANEQFYEINVVNGLVNEQESDVFYKGTNVTIKALDKSDEDLLFKHWTDSKGNIVSRESEYSFDVVNNEEYSANYIESLKVLTEENNTKTVIYNSTFNELNLPSMYLVEHNGKTLLLDIEWNEADYNENDYGTQVLYASLVDESLYEEYGINDEDLKFILEKLALDLELDEETNTYTITAYYGEETDLIIPSEYDGIQITKIGDMAFYYCQSLESVEIPDSVTYIGYWAFRGCDNINSVTLPYIGSSIEDSEYRYFGYLFGATTISTAYSYIPKTIKEITINGGTLGENAFIGCTSLERITLSSDIVSIHSTAFDACSLGTKVYFNGTKEKFEAKIFDEFESSKAYYIYEFYVQDENQEYYLYNEVEKDSVKNLISIEECIDLLLEDLSAYYGTEATKDNVHSISEESSKTMYDFFLTDEKYSELWGWLGEYLLQTRLNDENKSNGYEHLATNNNSYWRYEVWAFVNQTVRTSWPYSSDYSLEKNRVIFEIELYIAEMMGHYYVYHEASDATCEEPGHIAYISCARCDYIEGYEETDEALGHTYSDEWTVDLDPTYESVGYKSHHCINEGCDSKVDITEIPMLAYSKGLEYQWNETEDGYIVSGIGECTDTDIIIPSMHKGLPVTTIGFMAFYECEFLISVEIPNSVTNIDNGAFRACASLESVIIPSGVTRIGYYAFADCASLESIIVDEENSIYDSRENCNAIIETESNTLLIGCKNTVIPKNITRIEEYAFVLCTTLESIEIPNSVISIGYESFSVCTSLTNIVIPNSVTSIGPSAFSGCSSLESIEIPNSVTSIGSSAFKGCSSLESIIVNEENQVYDSRENCNAIIETKTNTLLMGCKNTVIPNSVTSIGSSAFYGCSSLESIEIPNSVTSIGSSTFEGCSSLTNIVIPNSVTSIGYFVFKDCVSLESIVIKNSVTSIGKYAFYGCSSLESIEIPNSVTSIGSSEFYGCSSLESIYYNGTIEEWENVEKNDLFDYFSANIYIKNNEGEYELYTN